MLVPVRSLVPARTTPASPVPFAGSRRGRSLHFPDSRRAMFPLPGPGALRGGDTTKIEDRASRNQTASSLVIMSRGSRLELLDNFDARVLASQSVLK